MQKKRFTAAINLSIEGGAQRGIIRGIIRYCQTHTMWHFIEDKGQPMVHPRRLTRCRYDGLITSLNERADLRGVRTRTVPVVAVTQGLHAKGIPCVTSDDAAIGRTGARHFLDRGFRHFAFYGSQRFSWSLDRERAFCDAVGQAGLPVAVRRVPHERTLDKEQPGLSRWLGKLPRPLAVMACDDLMGRHVLAACGELNFSVPADVAVLGVDNDDLMCELADPPLSSIVQDCDRIGFEAAALLDQMMAGKVRQVRHLKIPPLSIVTRRSTDVLAIEDREVAAALQLIHAHVGQSLNVKQLLAKMPMSRRTLERRFQAALGRKPAEEIRRIRLERAMHLLRTSSLSIRQVAAQAGFLDARGMDVVFRRDVRMSPSAYRRQFRDR